MADPTRVNQHVETAEYSKEKARLTAGAIVAGIALHELIADPEAYVSDVLAALLISLDSTLDSAIESAASFAADLGLPVLSPSDLEEIKQQVRDRFIEQTEPALRQSLDTVTQSISDMLDSGVSEEAVQASITHDSGRTALLASFAAIVAAAGAALIADAQRDVMDSATERYAEGDSSGVLAETSAADSTSDPTSNDAEDATTPDAAEMSAESVDDTSSMPATAEEPEFTWVTIGDGRECIGVFENSCDSRDGESMTLAEWDAVGRPGADNLLCTIYSRGPFSQCRCVLEPSDSEAGSNEPFDVSSSIKAGKDRARQEFQS